MKRSSDTTPGSASDDTPSLTDYITPRAVVTAAVSSLRPAAVAAAEEGAEVSHDSHKPR